MITTSFPHRIVCLSTESTEIVYALGAGERVVGVSGFVTRPPEAREKPKVSSFISLKMDKIREVKPDLVITFSDLQAQMAADLIKEGYTVLALNQRSVQETLEAILTIGRVIGCEEKAKTLIASMGAEINFIRQSSASLTHRPRVYFEEWDNPVISGIRWVSELIEIAGGQDIFPELKAGKNAKDRYVNSEEVVRRNPEIMFASWCGKKANLDAIRSRPGWDVIDAVKNNRIYEIKSPDILAPGPSFILGLKQIHKTILTSTKEPAII